MSAGLIKHLKKKTEEDSNTRILMSQWEFDEKLVGKSLENVGSYYPHFSSHNESHSQQILVNIERLLGSNIDKLTATDTWLILEAAYWHDIGMLFNADEVRDVIENEHFKDYVEELANNNVQDLHEFAKVWHNDGWEAALVHYDNPYKGVEKYRQMVAEWYRKGHAKNSNDVVLKPFEKLNISSPRTELLPNRIYRYLAQICLSHGKSFNYVMKDLPFRQTGMGTEDCHPRFVACLLRLGDLFDIDDNRFCPVMARQVGNMPSFSETHKHKHQAIREFQLDNETVSVTAICSTEMAYIECRNWFDWIKEEIQNQMSQWKNIVPSRDFGLLPTINKLDVEMDDSKVLLDGKPMKFALDEKNVIDLLQGNNLYHGVDDVVRELIQNAIDATLMRVWIDSRDNKSRRNTLEQGNPYDSEVREIFDNYSIIVSLDFIETTKNYENIWKLCIEDSGIGISLKDLKYMQYMGGSDKNLEKKKIINSMPQWMKPSGAFGIGMHSVFLLSRKNPEQYQHLRFLTKSIVSNESIEVKLNSPLSKDNGYCFISQLDQNSKYIPYGTRTELFLKTELSFSSDLVTNISKEANALLTELKNSISNIFINSIPDIVINNLDILLKKDIPIRVSEQSYVLEEDYRITSDIAWFNYKNYSFAIQIYVPETICSNDFGYAYAYSFRGQEIPIYRENVYLLHSFKNASVYIDIYGNAKEFLNISRNDWNNYDLLDDLIVEVKRIFEKMNITQDNMRKITYGFEYDKDLGFSIINNEVNDKDIDKKDIEKLKFNDDTYVSDIIKEDLFILGNPEPSNVIIELLGRDKVLSSIKSFNKINDIYYKGAIEYFLKNNFLIYKINFSGKLDNYNNKDTLLFFKPESLKNLEIKNALWVDDDNVAIFSPITTSSIIDNQEPIYLAEDYKFVNEIKEFDKLSEEDTIYIRKNYDDYQLFSDFKDLEIIIPDHYSYTLNTFYGESGIIFPFYFELDEIISHDFESLYKFVNSKAKNTNLSISEIEIKYKDLIGLISRLTKGNSKWDDFFSKNNYKY
ncbi:histidine kinase [Psychrobacter sp. ANT_H59]|uniref:HD domain-containing protein n=1 Tax=Psychrobacter sp. ANT_H59 TaxID=2597354 RepID=UPI0011EF1444|nr:histidine kinase [Psychrobacter sp. ANT_H59]KAA0938967.1 histidine kinase [Psychrobacter sp. ANT_H59]